MVDVATLSIWAGALTLGVGLALVAVGTTLELRKHRKLTALPPRRRYLGDGIEIEQPGQPDDAQARCLRCPWEASAGTVLEAHGALTEHVRRAHGGIA